MAKKAGIILFDIDNCLSDSKARRDYIFQALEETCKIDAAAADAIYTKAFSVCQKKFGGVEIDTFAGEIAKQLNTYHLYEKVKNIFLNLPHEKFLMPKANEVLKQLAEKYQLGIQSDGSHAYQMAKIKPLLHLFQPQLIKTYVNKKIEIYQTLKELPKDVVITDDKPDYVFDLQNHGRRAIHFNYGRYAAAAKNYKIKETVSSLEELSILL